MARLLSRSLILVVLGTLLFLVAPRQSALAADQVVTNCANDDELRADLAAVQSTGGGTLTFKCGTKTIVLDTGAPLPTITSNVTVDGGGKITLSGGNTTRFFYVNTGAILTVENITLTNGYAEDDGGAIFNLGTLLVSNSKFLENKTDAAHSGGAIVSYGGLYIDHSEFANNSAGSGGAIYPRHAASTSITNSNLHHNFTISTVNGWGGALLLWNGATVTLENTTITDNQARWGGAIYVTENSVLNVNNSEINYNQALNGSGGGIYAKSNTFITNSTLAGNGANTSGGAIDWYFDYDLALTNVTLSNNSAPWGGGISVTKAKGTLTNVTIVGNSATFGGGGIDNGTYASEGLTLKNIILAYNTGGNCHDINAKTINSAGFNLSSDTTCTEFFDQGGDKNNVDPLLGDLALNGGPTKTRLPKAGSPAINAGTGVGAPPTDQRGFSRPQGSAVDMGAGEICENKPAKPVLTNPGKNKKVKAKVQLAWDAADCGVSYNVVVKVGSAAGATVFSRKNLFVTGVNAKLAKGVTYFWQVTAVNELGKTKSAGSKFTTK